jgi:site-specific DNA-methyltransferase (adenine-specific)
MLKENLLKNEKVKPNSREIELLKQNFPQFFSKEGKFLLEKFKEMLKMEDVKIDKEGYELKFLGKNYARFLTSTETETVIVPNVKHNEEEINKNSENLYIIGDNLDALKHLLNSYSGKIKCIYIDPPYNTGSDGFVYNDNFEYTPENISEKMGIELEEAQRIIDMRGKSTHSAWLTFMYPRLVLARDLLREDGVIFISIDDNEQANLKMVCDEIFGEENFVDTLIWKKLYGGKNDVQWFAHHHDYILTYSKNKNLWQPNLLPRNEKQNERYKNPDNDPRGPWTSSDFTQFGPTPNCIYEIETPSGIKYLPQEGKRWITTYDSYLKLREENRLWFGENGENMPRLKRYLSEVKQGVSQTTFLEYTDVGHGDEANKELKKLFENKIFDYPKPVRLLKRLCFLALSPKDIILDFFSGSATTAHAVMQLNAEDDGNRKYIMVQLPEKTYEEKINKEGKKILKAKKGCEKAYKAGYKTIDEIGIERIKRAAKKIKEETQAEIDYGFKIVKLETPNSNTLDKIVDFNPDDNKLILDNFIDEFKFGETEGYDTILTTWLNQDGYGMNVKSQKVLLKNFEIDVFENSAYVIKEGISSEDVMELITRVEKNEIAITRLVVYPYSVSFNVLHEMKKNFKNLRGNKELKLIERY